MRSAGAIFRKLKEAKFRHLIALYKLHLKRVPENCKYNYGYPLLDSLLEKKGHGKVTVRLCLLHQDGLDLEKGVYPHLLTVCQELADCQNCNGFITRYSREAIKELFETELNTKSIKEKKYPDICALEWVLEKSSLGIFPATWIQKLYFYIKSLATKPWIL